MYALWENWRFNSEKHRGTVLVFSGPVTVLSAHEADIEAILYVMNEILLHNLCMQKVVICSDSIMAINSIYKGLSIDFPMVVQDFDTSALFNGHVSLKHIPGTLYINADQLAKKGALRLVMKAFEATS